MGKKMMIMFNERSLLNYDNGEEKKYHLCMA